MDHPDEGRDPLETLDDLTDALPGDAMESLSAAILSGDASRIGPASTEAGLSPGALAGLAEFVAGRSASATPRTAAETLDDLRYQPVIGQVAERLMEGRPRTAVLLMVAHESYPLASAEGAAALLARELDPPDVDLVECAPPDVSVLPEGVPPRPTHLARKGHALIAGHFERRGEGEGARAFFRHGWDLSEVATLRQVWLIVERGEGT